MFRKAAVVVVALAALLGVRAQDEPVRPGLPVAPALQNIGPGRAPAFNRAPRRAIHEPFVPPMTAAKIRSAIDDAVYHLRSLPAGGRLYHRLWQSPRWFDRPGRLDHPGRRRRSRR